MEQRIAILGLGDFGCNLARLMVELRAEVIATDKDPEQVKRISPYVSKAVVADITKRQALLEAGIDTADVAVIATTEPFESSVLAAHHLKELKVPLVVAKATDEDQAQILSLMGVARTFTPEMESAIRAAYMIAYPRMRDYMNVGEDYFVVWSPARDSFVGKSVAELEAKINLDVLALRPADHSTSFKSASGDQLIAAGDELLLHGSKQRLLDLKKVK